ncbi:lactonase family protein [Ferranicluibacter rubi]|nr:lactonase family protein [Ferranicluibacter rubi]TCQ20061.1 6-phosphogluconolactonase [Rhizobium sp. PP-CC-3G-465]
MPKVMSVSALCLTIAATSMVSATVSRAETYVYVSAATDGKIDTYRLDETSGNLKSLGDVDAGTSVMPMTVSPDRTRLYAVVRSQPYRVLTYAINPSTGSLTEKASAALPDSMPYVSIDPSGRLLFFASYGGNKIASLPVGLEGLVKDGAKQVIPTGHNAHSIVSDKSGKYIFVTNLGADAVLQYRLNGETGLLEPNSPASVQTKPGQGPRHIVVSPDNRSIYILTELTGEVIHYALDAATGTLAERDTATILPPESTLEPGVAPPPPPPFSQPLKPAAASTTTPPARIWAADIGVTPDGRFVYATERSTSIITAFAVDPETGALTRLSSIGTEKQPRGIRIDPTGRFLIASGEKSDRLSVYAIDGQTGRLTEQGRYPVGKGANWIEIVDVP